MDRRQAQVGQRRDQAGHRRGVQQVEERIAPSAETGIDARPEPAQGVEQDRIDHPRSYPRRRAAGPKPGSPRLSG
jgi:hypothetical protein